MYIRENLSKKEKILSQLTSYLTSSLRVQGRTAYITASLSAGTQSAASLQANAMSLIVLATRNLTNPLVEKLGRDDCYLCIYYSQQITLHNKQEVQEFTQ